MELEIENNKTISNEILNNVTEEKQNHSIKNVLGNAINTGFDLGIRMLLPDLIENQVIDIKNVILKNGFKEGINTAIQSVIDLGKSALGIFTGKFDNISQIETAAQKGGLVNTVSKSLDGVIKAVAEQGLISNKATKIIKGGKKVIIDNIQSNLDKTLTKQIKGIENVNKYINQWKEFYNEKDFSKMNREYNKLIKELEEVIPFENTIKEARKIENIHKLIENNGQNFNLSEEEIALANKL